MGEYFRNSMCGISGKLKYRGGAVRPEDITAMVRTLHHRGPDSCGIFNKGKIGLGHTRLSIIDLTSAGQQPMSAFGSTIVFNGEIYNFKEIRAALMRDGYSFQTKTDTEVILALYHKYREDCVHHLRGMFAFALWNEASDTLFLARDRIGKKPLLYFLDEKTGTLIFASEIKALLINPEVKKNIHWESLSHFLSLQYIPSPLTIYENVFKLPPAHTLTFRNGKMDIQRYWQLDSTKHEYSEKRWEKIILESLTRSVGLRMVSDVPLGAFLSGGLDSSAIVAIMSSLSSEPIQTFSIGFEQSEYDESSYARLIAKHFKTSHHEFRVEASSIQLLENLVSTFDEPFADPSALPTWYLSSQTKKHVSVILTGDGGDECFAGYQRYSVFQADMLASRASWLVKYMLPHLEALKSSQVAKLRYVQRLVRYFNTASADPQNNYISRFLSFTDKQKRALFSDTMNIKMDSMMPSEDIVRQHLGSYQLDWLDKLLTCDLNLYLPENLMVKVDMASMAHGLECRSPFLDHEFVQLAYSIPSRLKIKGIEKKYILKKALRHLLPNEIIYRKKMGFGVPLDHWFRGELKEYVRDRLLSKRACNRGLFRTEAIRKLIEDHEHGIVNNMYSLWPLLVLEEWFRVWID